MKSRIIQVGMENSERRKGLGLAILGCASFALNANLQTQWGSGLWGSFETLVMAAIGMRAALYIAFPNSERLSFAFNVFSAIFGGCVWGAAVGGTLSGIILYPFIGAGGEIRWLFVPAVWALYLSIVIGLMFGVLQAVRIISRHRIRPRAMGSVLTLFSILSAQADASVIGVEKGDLIFRELAAWQDVPFLGYIGHTGIYWKYVGGDPADKINHRIIEALDLTGVWVTTLKGFYDTAPFLGAGSKNPTHTRRSEIVDFASRRAGKGYTLCLGYKGPDEFRCDGLAEAT